LEFLMQMNGTDSQGRNERGAALITTLMIAAMVLTAGGLLLLTSSMSAAGTVDAAAEMQAYYGAEAGLQATLNVLRGNVMPNPLFQPNPQGGVDPANQMSVSKAVNRSTSNLAGDPTTAGFPARLSRWLTYNYTPSGSSYADRVAITSGYNPIGGIAYSIKVTDPDNSVAPTRVTRLLIESTGYGPKNAVKKISILLSAYGLNITTPAPLVIRGHDDKSTAMIFDIGSSNSKDYSGKDNAVVDPDKHAFAVSPHDVDTAEAAYLCGTCKPQTIYDPKMGVLDLPNEQLPPSQQNKYAVLETPWFLRTANDARSFMAQVESIALKKGGIVTNGNFSGTSGTTANPLLRLVKGDCDLDGGAGLLVITGQLTLNGGPNFDGIILVLGQGKVIKKGGGNGNLYGAMMIASFGSTGDFLKPSFDVSGGGGSNLQYDSRWLENSRLLTGEPVLGVVER
jgi:hypothetical protein